ncbi:peptidase propeptide and YPEB domain protein, partial [Enterococcus faecalis]
MTGFALFFEAGCTPKTPTAVSSTNEHKETVLSTSETCS